MISSVIPVGGSFELLHFHIHILYFLQETYFEEIYKLRLYIKKWKLKPHLIVLCFWSFQFSVLLDQTQDCLCSWFSFFFFFKFFIFTLFYFTILFLVFISSIWSWSHEMGIKRYSICTEVELIGAPCSFSCIFFLNCNVIIYLSLIKKRSLLAPPSCCLLQSSISYSSSEDSSSHWMASPSFSPSFLTLYPLE